MQAYRVSINMSNCLRQAGDEQFQVNCAIQCDVDAGSSAGAEAAAIALLRDCSELQDALANEPHNSPLIEVEHVDPVDAIELHQPDLAWYAPDDA